VKDDIRVYQWTTDEYTKVGRPLHKTGKHNLSILQHCYVEKGSLEDWKILHELHYKSSNLGIGPRYMRLVLDIPGEPLEVIGVMVFTVPKPLDSGRNEVFPHLRPNFKGRDTRLINQQRMMWLNKNLILSSRTVLDTMYRGAGLAYRFKNIGYRMMGFRYVESRSSMSRFNPFSIKAGMRFVPPKPASALMDGLKFFQRNFKAPGYDFVAIMEELRDMAPVVRERALAEMRAFYYKKSSMEKSGDNRLNGTSRVESMEISYLLKQIQQLVFGSTVYAVWVNPDYDATKQQMRPLPPRIPVLAFELQKVNEPLRLDLIPEDQLKPRE
jgi:hypothetical protein